MSSRYRLLAVDLDGTLLDSDNRLPPPNRDALHRAHEAGLIVCLTTGRCYTEARPVLDEIGLDLDVAVVACGAIISEARSGRTLHAAPMPADAMERVCRFLSDRDFSFLLTHDVWTAGIDYSLIRRPRWSEAYDRWFSLMPCAVREVPHWRDLPAPVYRITVFKSPDFFREVRPALQEELPGDVTKHNNIYLPAYGLHVLEFFAPQVNKWSALERLGRDYDITAEQVVAIGDAINDLEMIRGAGLSFAVANACDEVRRAAAHIVPSNDEAGAAAAIDRVLANTPTTRRSDSTIGG